MQNVTLDVPGIAYAVLIAGEANAREWLVSLVAGRDVLIVTDVNVAPLHLERAKATFADAAWLESLVLAAGDEAKTLAAFEKIVDVLVAGRFHRDALVVALGGGVIGDMAGFAAACYQRGVDWIAVPTTLLAQVDAALGGKTAVNHPEGKNLIGAFHDPLAVWADPATLATLPEREFRAGFGEVVKYGLGFDADFFDWLEAHASRLLEKDASALAEVVVRCARIKLEVVAADRTERGGRACLNLGHTIGHALETALGHGTWLHGEAVAVGLVAAARLCVERGTLELSIVARLRRLLDAFGLPTVIPPEADEAALATAFALDKKIVGGRLRFVGLRRLGQAEIWNDVESDELRHIIAATREAS